MTKLGLGELDKSGIAELTFKGRGPKIRTSGTPKPAAKTATAKGRATSPKGKRKSAG
jgi:hypothetical protein